MSGERLKIIFLLRSLACQNDVNKANVTCRNHIMWTMGDDFMHQYAESWLRQMDKLINYVNKVGATFLRKDIFLSWMQILLVALAGGIILLCKLVYFYFVFFITKGSSMEVVHGFLLLPLQIAARTTFL